jgi:AcrR family transcriptional regulator
MTELDKGADPEAMTPAMRAVWGIGNRPRGGRAPSLTIVAIVEAALALADRDGLAACSMPKLAGRLGVATMALYRYVSSKDELCVLMLDAARGQFTPDAHGRTWRQVLVRYADHALAAYTAHPWALDIPTAGFPQTPNLLDWLDYGLSALAVAGLDDQQQLGTMLLLDGHATNTARLARASANNPRRRSEPPATLMSPSRFPALSRLIAAGALRDDDFADYGYRFGLDRILTATENLMP